MYRLPSTLTLFCLGSFAYAGTLQVLPSKDAVVTPITRGCTINSTFVTKNNTLGYTITLGKSSDFFKIPLPNKIDMSGYEGVIVTIKNEGTTSATFDFSTRGVHPDLNETVLGLWNTLAPGVKKNLLFWINKSVAPFQMNYPLPETNETFSQAYGYTIKFDPKNVTAMQIWSNNATPMTLTIEDVRFLHKRTDYSMLVDSFGQWNKYSFPNKISSAAELPVRAENERNALAQMSDVSNRNGIDGLPMTTATGRWRTEKAPNGNWFFVTPEGKRFWMLGLNCVTPGDGPVVEGREVMYQNLPPRSGNSAPFYSQQYNATSGYRWTYNFYQQNLSSKYGANWTLNWVDRTILRMSKFGFNATLSHIDDGVLKSNVPNIWMEWTRDFPKRIVTPWIMNWTALDPFDPTFEPWLLARYTPLIAKLNALPNVIGFQSDNELSWGYRSDPVLKYSVPIGILNSPITVSGKLNTMYFLKGRYARDINALNTAWGTTYADWTALEQPNAWGSRQITAAAALDLRDILLNYTHEYFTKVKRVLTNLNFKGMYLGTRDSYWATPKEVFEAETRYVDAISVNLYTETDSVWNELNSFSKPVLISEFSYSASDAGNFTPDVSLEVANQAERASRTSKYRLRATSMKNIVGACWWRYVDDPVTGRWSDDERMDVGIVDITDTPYTEMVDAFRSVAGNISKLRPSN